MLACLDLGRGESLGELRTVTAPNTCPKTIDCHSPAPYAQYLPLSSTRLSQAFRSTSGCIQPSEVGSAMLTSLSSLPWPGSWQV